MAIRSGFFNSVGGDRLYCASEFAEYFAAFIGTGVFPDPSTNLQIQAATGLQIKVKAGKAWISGYILINDADYLETLTADAVLNRIDRMVVRLHYSNRTMSIARKVGSLASSPAAPGITRDSEMFELSLALISVPAGSTLIPSGNITDTRGDSAVCGFVSSTITNIPYLTPEKVLISDSEGELGVSSITSSELGMLAGVTSLIQDQINAKQALITGAITSFLASNATSSRVIVSDVGGKLVVSLVTSVELGYLSGLTSAIQAQLNGKQASITGAASSIVSSNLTTNKVAISDGSGKLATSSVTTTELGYLAGITSAIQTQLNDKLGLTGQAADSLKVGGKKVTVGTTAPTSPAMGDVWVDTN
ncbi:MAG: hypothetical protein JZU49_06240 [Sulfuricurvum sp.]|nr:hypothetical protein [Sulfuricurvum sp.]